MRMEELSDSRYIKSTDTVERYLLNLVQEYFNNNSNVASSTSKEYIIKKAVERMKEEITFDSIGVLSITLPDGEQRTGAVTITLEDLNGEPLISPKLSAFNVNFGNEQGTACEGNDPRLSDARIPLAHKHEVKDIVGLEGILSSFNGKMERVESFMHEHNNKSLLDILVYTGDKTVIDLTTLDTLENKVAEIAEEIRQEIIDYKEEVNDKIKEFNTSIKEVQDEASELNQLIIDKNKEYYDTAKKYTDDAIKTAEEAIQQEIENLIAKNTLADIISIASKTYTLAGTMSFSVSSVLDINSIEKQQSGAIPIEESIITELANRNQLLEDCQIESIIEYKELSTGSQHKISFPYIVFKNNAIDGSLQLSTDYLTQQIAVTFNTETEMSEEIKDATIRYNVYSKQAIAL